MRKFAALFLAVLIALIAFDFYPRTMPIYGQVYPQPPNVGLLAARPAFCANTGQQYYATDTTTLYYSTVPGTNCTWTAVGGTGGGTVLANATLGGAPSSLYTFFPAPSSACSSYSVSGTTFCAVNNSTGVVDFSGTDMAVVLNSVLTAKGTVGGTIYFKNGIYSINSATAETNAGCATGLAAPVYYGIGIPANALGSNVQWRFVGEQAPMWLGEYGTAAIQSNGVIFNVTSTAVTAAGSGFLAAIWQRPNDSGTTCNFVTANFSNDDYFENLWTRFPTNTRGNEGGIVMWSANSVRYKNAGSDFNLQYTAIATGSAPVAGTVGSFGLTSTYSGASVPQRFDDTFVTGYNIGYDFLSEHVDAHNAAAIYCNYPGEIGRVSTTHIFHPVLLTNFHDQENANGFIFGPGMIQGSRVDFLALDMEFGGGDSNWYTTARAGTAKMSETNAGFTTGFIYYQAVLANSGITAEIPSNTLFTSGGQNFQAFEGTAPPSIALAPISDTFTRPNSSGGTGINLLGPMWSNGTQSGNVNLKIASNSAQVNQTGLAGGYSFYLAQPMNPDQFSKATCSTLTATTGDFCEVIVRGSINPAVQTYYAYYAGGTAASGRGIVKLVAATPTTLASQTSSAGASNDVLELDVIGNTLWAYRNGALDTSFPNPITDSSITSGAPGINLVDQTTAAVAMKNWSGGSLPTLHGTDSAYNNPSFFKMMLSSGTPPTPTGTGACATITTQVPASVGAQAGSLRCTGTTGASTITLTFPAAQAAPNGYRCSADDETTVANKPVQTSTTTTTCVLTVSSVTANDFIIWNATPF